MTHDQPDVARIRERLGDHATAFALLRGLTLVAGVTALFIVPVSAEHQIHRGPLLAGFALYNAALLAVLVRWAAQARRVFLVTLAADLAVVFLLVWFTGGGGSHYYLLFYLLVTLNAYTAPLPRTLGVVVFGVVVAGCSAVALRVPVSATRGQSASQQGRCRTSRQRRRGP